MIFPDGKRMMDVNELEELRKKYVESKLDPAVLKDVSSHQFVYFLYPHEMKKLEIQPDVQDDKQKSE